jgi:hypothetical protein
MPAVNAASRFQWKEKQLAALIDVSSKVGRMGRSDHIRCLAVLFRHFTEGAQTVMKNSEHAVS